MLSKTKTVNALNPDTGKYEIAKVLEEKVTTIVVIFKSRKVFEILKSDTK